MKLKRVEIIEICEVLDSFKNEMNKFFVYHISKIRKILDEERNLIIMTGKPSEEYLKYENLKMRIINKYCEKDENEKLIEFDGKYKVIDQFKENIKNELIELNESNKEIIEIRKKEMTDFVSFLSKEVEIEINKIPLLYIPEFISKEKMDILLSIIEEK